jgi:hypothetical protein
MPRESYSLKPGYSFAFKEGGFAPEDVPNDMWDTVVI